jgi:hypothetical protein
MERRGFLGALLKFGAALMLPKLPAFAAPALDSPGAVFIDETVVKGTGLLQGLTFASERPWRADQVQFGDAWAGASEVGAYRKNGEAVAVWGLAPGGMLNWIPSSPGMALAFDEREPLILRAGSGTRLRAIYSIGGESFMFHRDGRWGQDAVIDTTVKAVPLERPSITRGDPDEFRYESL